MILAGDIGGTKTRLALFRAVGNQCKPVRMQSFLSRDYPGLEEILKEWLKGRTRSIRAACFGVAGPVINARSKTTNLPWIVDAKQISQRFGIASVWLLNDLQAMAYGALQLGEEEYSVLNPGQPDPHGNKAVIAAGTGLGEAILFRDGAEYHASASGGGHTDFAPRSQIEIKLLEYLWKQFTRVSYERVLSGPGLVQIYEFLKETGHNEEPSWLASRLKEKDPATVITEAALAGTDKVCGRALDQFVSLYGAEAGNLALKAFATGGVYIGGGIAPKILDKLRSGEFMKAFTDKGRYSTLMGRIPVQVILNEETGLLGAASFAQRHVRRTRRTKG
jgi:glucokinase